VSKFRTATRIVHRLLISIFLVLTPVLGVFTPAAPVSAHNFPLMRLPWAGGDRGLFRTYNCADSHVSAKDRFAIDFDLDIGTPVTAVFNGTVRYHVPDNAGYGNILEVVSTDGVHRALYAHLRTNDSSMEGRSVQIGDVIGESGVSGDGANGIPHLHFNIRTGATDPFNGTSEIPEPMSRYSGIGGATTCNTRSGTLNPNNGAPGGVWQGVTPANNAAKNKDDRVDLSFWANDNGNTGLDYANLTIWTPSKGWRILPIAPGQNANMTQNFNGQSQGFANAWFKMPAEPVIVSADVYSNNDNRQLSPNGTRRICYNSQCPPAQVAVSRATQSYEGNVGGGAGSAGGGSQTNCTPGSWQTAVFTDPNYGGSCVIKGLGEYPTPESIGLPNDSISSIKMGSGANVRLCDNAGLNSPCEYISIDDPDLANNMIGTNTVSSLKVEDTAPGRDCVPNDYQVAFFMNENYQETCILRGVGRYNDAGALGLPNDTISSVKIGARVKVRICDNVNNDSPCDQFENNVPDLTPTTVQNNRASSAEVTLKGGIALCDNTNYGGECKYFGAGDTGENLQNMSSHGFDNRVESVRYDPDWEGRYHIVLYTDQNQTGYLYHADGSSPDLRDPYNNNISSIKIYKNNPPNARALAPASGTNFPSTITSVILNYTEGQERRVHVWNNNGYDVTSDWAASETYTLNNLAPGTYSWQAQSRSPIIGEGAWSPVQTFSINTPPTVTGGSLTMDAGTTQSVQVQAFDAEGGTLTLAASGLPVFATFTDNGGGIGTLQLSPSASQSGQFNITVTANDGAVTGTEVIAVTVNAATPPPPPPPPAGYQATYFNNLTLSGTPVLTRSEASIDNDWGGGGPGNGVNNDNFSARWTRAQDFAAGSYTFSVTADDGVRLYIDDVLAIDKWIDQGPTTYTANKTLAAGSHTVKIEYYERGGGAVAKFSYQAYTVPVGTPGITSGGIYKIVNAGSSKALDVTGASTANGAKIQIWTDTGVVAQKWQFTQNSDGTYTILNPNSNKILDVDGASTANGAAIQIWSDDAGSNQRWVVTQNSDSTYKLRPAHTSRVMDVNGGSSANGTKVQIWDDNGSAAQKWQISSVSIAPPIQPTFTGNGTVAASTIVAGNTITMNGSFTSTSSTNSATRIHFEVRSPSDQQVFAKDFDNEAFTPGQTKNYTASWAIPSNAATGGYVVKGGAVSADWGTWYLWLNNMGQFTVNAPAPPPPQTGTELLSAAWNLVGNNGANEKYQSIASNALAGKTTLRVTYDLHGLTALGGDASAIIFDQNGWKFVSLSNYGQNGLNGTQTVDIPLSAFGLNLSQSVGTLHTRFWYGGPFTVDITSIKVL
jgi:hypothetical protein